MNLSQIKGRVLTRLELGPDDLQVSAAAIRAINEGQRLFAFLTLCLEQQREFVLTPGVQTYRMFSEGWADWIAPLRVRLSNDTGDGQTAEWDTQKRDIPMFGEQGYSGLTATAAPKLAPATIYDMAAIDSGWLGASGTPTRYGCLGWDFLFLDRAPTQEGQKLLITYAHSSPALVNDTDAPAIPESDHEALIDFGEFRLRCNEGGQELQVAIARLKSFLDVAKQRADQVRARSLAQRYDRLPFELEDFDYSRLLQTRSGLPPYRKENRWTS